MAENQVRILLWTNLRSISTAFTICMTNLEDAQIINQPYYSAYLTGPDSQKKDAILELREKMKIADNLEVDCKDVWESESCSYEHVKQHIMEAEYPDKKVVFVKDISEGIIDNLHMLPKGYRHAFLIRSPEKVFPSFKKLLNSFSEKEIKIAAGKTSSYVISEQYLFGESVQLYEHLVKTGIEPNPFIMDADDLLEDPESILRQFCSFAGVEYTDKLLAWGDSGSDATRSWKTSKEILQWNKIGGWHKNAYSSKGFRKPTPAPPRSELSEDVIHCIDASLPYYRKLYELRARIN